MIGSAPSCVWWNKLMRQVESMRAIPPERAATSRTPGRSLIASRTCVCLRGRNLAAAACVLAPERCSSWNTCCPDLLALVNLQQEEKQGDKHHVALAKNEQFLILESSKNTTKLKIMTKCCLLASTTRQWTHDWPTNSTVCCDFPPFWIVS